MIDQNPVPSVSRSERREKETSVARIPRDPETPQKFQSIVDQGKQQKEGEMNKKEEPIPSNSIFDISSQKARARAHTQVHEGGGKDVEAMKSTHIVEDKGKGIVEGKGKGIVEGKGKKPSDETTASARTKGEQKTSGASALARGENDDSSLEIEHAIEKKGTSDEHSKEEENTYSSQSTHTDVLIQPVVADIIVPKDLPSNIPPVAPTIALVDNVSKPEAVPATRDLQEIIDHVVNSISLLQANDQTDLLVTLRNPPILSGAELVLSSYGSAKGEFNVAFYNLTQESQQFLQQMHAQTGIKQALEQKGYIMHMFITSAQPYQPIVATDTDNRTDQRRFHDDQEGKGQGGQRQKDEDA